MVIWWSYILAAISVSFIFDVIMQTSGQKGVLILKNMANILQI